MNNMKKLLRRLLWVLVIIAVGVGGFRLYLENQQSATSDAQPLVMDSVIVGSGELIVTVSATGAIAPLRQVPLLFELSAPIAEILVLEGQVVQTGDIVARLDVVDYATTLFDASVALELQQLAFNALSNPPRDEDIAVARAAVVVAQSAVNASYSTSLSQATTQEEISRLQLELAGNQLWQTQLQHGASLTAATVNPIDFNSIPSVIIDNVPPDILDDVVNNINNLLSGLTPSINPAQFELQMNQAGANVAIAEANYTAAQNRPLDTGALSNAQLGLVQAQVTLDRLLNGISPLDLEIAELDLQRTQLALRQAELLLSKTELLAPFDGIIAQVNLTIGELPPTTQPALLLMDTSSYIVDLPVDETDVVNVEVGQRVTFVLDALPNAEVTGVVERVSFTPTYIGNLVTYLVRVRIDPTTAPIKVGMSVTARIATKELPDAVLVPNRYIRIERGTQQAFVTIERGVGRYEEIPIVIGARNERFTQVISGISVGDVLVLLPRNEAN